MTYRLTDGDIYKLDARRGASPVDISVALDGLSPHAPDEWLNTSPNGHWLLTGTERFGCAGWACLARVSGSLRSGGALMTAGAVIHPDSFGAISSDGRVVVFPNGGGPHTRDLWVTRLQSGRWTSPKIITARSRTAYNVQPAISGDGRRVLFSCSPGVPEAQGEAICSVSSSGGPVTLVMPPTGGPGGTTRNFVEQPAFGLRGDALFEGNWRGERIWRLPHGSRRPVLVSRVGNDNSPCLLPDGRIVSLYFDRPGNRTGMGELRVANYDGSHGFEILTDHDVADIGIGCG